MSEQMTADEFFAWRTAMRRKHRTMTLGEYMAWCRGGDSISHPTSANAFPSGITIILDAPPIIGKID